MACMRSVVEIVFVCFLVCKYSFDTFLRCAGCFAPV